MRLLQSLLNGLLCVGLTLAAILPGAAYAGANLVTKPNSGARSLTAAPDALKRQRVGRRAE